MLDILNSIKVWFIDNAGWLDIVRILAVVILGYVLIAIIVKISRRIVNRSHLKGLAGKFIINIIKVILFFVYIIAIMSILGIDTSSLVAVLAASSLAISLALQSTMTNFASGMLLVGNKPFKEGDFIEGAGVSGTVLEITLSSTKLRTPDNKIVTIPNAKLAEDNIINYSTEEKRRVDLTFGVAYGSDVEKVKLAITSVLDEHSLILHDEGYTVRLSSQDDSALTFVCRSWVKNADYWAVYFDLNEKMLQKFEKEGIEIPYNKLDVNIISQK